MRLISTQPDFELAETYYNSIHRRIAADERIDETQSFVWSEFDEPPVRPSKPIFRTYPMHRDMVATVTQILRDLDFDLPWQDIERDVRNILRSLAEARPEIRRPAGLDVEILESIFYRNKGAYLVGSLRYGGNAWPVVLPILVDDDNKLYVDTLICDEDELSVVFSYTRSYFMVDAPHPYALVDYLNALLPGKKRSELYAAIGMHKHGKTEFYRGFLTHLARSKDQFQIAPGIKGMVMTVFTLPSYQTVFKVIKDEFAPQKDITREQVKEKYYVVKTHDRVGRMADTQEFIRFALPRARFSPELIEELKAVAAIVDHAERRSRHHRTSLHRAADDAAQSVHRNRRRDEQIREVLDEYGNAIKQLAAANIFPGDMLLKNFGVTRHGRVVFYDYDEICYLTDVNFRALPTRAQRRRRILCRNLVQRRPTRRFPGGVPPLSVRTSRHQATVHADARRIVRPTVLAGSAARDPQRRSDGRVPVSPQKALRASRRAPRARTAARPPDTAKPSVTSGR